MARATAELALAGVPRVNLMPPREIERRKRGALVRGWGWAVLVATLIVALVVGGAFALKYVADQALASQEAETAALLTEFATLSEVSGALGKERELELFRADALGSDFAWVPVVSTIASALPENVRLTGFDLITGGIPQGTDPSREIGLTGTITLVSPDPIDLPTTIRELRAIESVVDVDGRSVTEGQQAPGTYDYELAITFDQSIYSGQYRVTEGAE